MNETVGNAHYLECPWCAEYLEIDDLDLNDGWSHEVDCAKCRNKCNVTAVHPDIVTTAKRIDL